MCGIAGIFQLDQTAEPPSVETLRAMTASLAHRGPDDCGEFVSPDRRCLLGHRRLSVIDLACGHQPMAGEAERVWTVFNGEIYNFQELRATLAAHPFKTQSDTEVLVHGWEAWGTSLPDRLGGMFALAIWDEAQKSLFLARDPLGKKPLYYSEHGGVLRFASELKGLMADPSLPRDVDPEAVLLYLTLGYVPDPWTILRGVKKLPPGHWLLAGDGKVQVERYWKPPPRPSYRGSYADAVAELRQLLTTAVRRRLIADVPLGAFLSGGIDSTIVVGLMSQLMSRPVSTFTIGFDEAKFDETPFARIAAGRFKTDHHEQIVRPNALEVLPKLAHHFDEPFADSSAIPTYYVSQFARHRVTVALTGDGGDEAFGGYRRYRAGRIAERLARVPGARRMARAARHLIPSGVDRTTNLGRARRVLARLGESASDAYLEQVTQFDGATMDELLSPDFVRQIDASVPSRWFALLYEGTDPADPAAASMNADFGSYLPGDILTKVDRASMAVSLECRSPLLDRDVVDFACALPTDWRLRGLSGHKHILKETFADLLPQELVNHRKTGFAVPLAEWFRGPLKGLLHDTLLDQTARRRGYVEPAVVEGLVNEHVAGGKNHAASLWTLLMLEMWFKTWGMAPSPSGRGLG